MQQGTWTIGPCPHGETKALAAELGISEITASVLVRRGYGVSAQARAFLAGEQPLHDPRRRHAGRANLRARRLRLRRNLRDSAPPPRPAGVRRGPGWAPAEPVR